MLIARPAASLAMQVKLMYNKAAFVAVLVTVMPFLFSSLVGANDTECREYNPTDDANKDNYWYRPVDFKLPNPSTPFFHLKNDYAHNNYDFTVKESLAHLGKARMYLGSTKGGDRQFKIKMLLKDDTVKEFWLSFTNCVTNVPYSRIQSITARERCNEKVDVCKSKPYWENP